MNSEKYVLITGASSGIGLELARLFARDGYSLILTGRNAEALGNLSAELRSSYKTNPLILIYDLADSSAPAEIFGKIADAGLNVEILINNAGYGTAGKFWDIAAAEELAEIQVNISALTHLTKLFLPGMISRRSGKIMNVASTAAFQPGPLMAVYYATKAYVLSFTEAINEELKGTGVSACCLCPGATATGFQKRAGLENSILFSMHVMDAKTVAYAAYRGLQKNKAIIIPGLMNKLLPQLERFVPRRAVTSVVRFINGKLK